LAASCEELTHWKDAGRYWGQQEKKKIFGLVMKIMTESDLGTEHWTHQG